MRTRLGAARLCGHASSSSPGLSARLQVDEMSILRAAWRIDGDQSPPSSLGTVPKGHNFFFLPFI